MDKTNTKSNNKFLLILIPVVLVIIAIILFFIFSDKGFKSIKIIELFGKVTFDRGVDRDIPVYDNMSLTSGDTIRTGSNDESYARLRLDSDKVAFLEQDSEAYFDLAKGFNRKNITIRLNYGSIINEIDTPLGDNDTYEVRTPNALMAVRGTRFRVSCYQGADGIFYTKISGLEGKVECFKVMPDGQVSSESKIAQSGDEAIIFYDDSANETDFVHFDAKGSPLPSGDKSGEITRKIRFFEMPTQALKAISNIIDEGNELPNINKSDIDEAMINSTAFIDNALSNLPISANGENTNENPALDNVETTVDNPNENQDNNDNQDENPEGNEALNTQTNPTNNNSENNNTQVNNNTDTTDNTENEDTAKKPENTDNIDNPEKPENPDNSENPDKPENTDNSENKDNTNNNESTANNTTVNPNTSIIIPYAPVVRPQNPTDKPPVNPDLPSGNDKDPELPSGNDKDPDLKDEPDSYLDVVQTVYATGDVIAKFNAGYKNVVLEYTGDVDFSGGKLHPDNFPSGYSLTLKNTSGNSNIVNLSGCNIDGSLNIAGQITFIGDVNIRNLELSTGGVYVESGTLSILDSITNSIGQGAIRLSSDGNIEIHNMVMSKVSLTNTLNYKSGPLSDAKGQAFYSENSYSKGYIVATSNTIDTGANSNRNIYFNVTSTSVDMTKEGDVTGTITSRSMSSVDMLLYDDEDVAEVTVYSAEELVSQIRSFVPGEGREKTIIYFGNNREVQITPENANGLRVIPEGITIAFTEPGSGIIFSTDIEIKGKIYSTIGRVRFSGGDSIISGEGLIEATNFELTGASLTLKGNAKIISSGGFNLIKNGNTKLVLNDNASVEVSINYAMDGEITVNSYSDSDQSEMMIFSNSENTIKALNIQTPTILDGVNVDTLKFNQPVTLKNAVTINEISGSDGANLEIMGTLNTNKIKCDNIVLSGNGKIKLEGVTFNLTEDSNGGRYYANEAVLPGVKVRVEKDSLDYSSVELPSNITVASDLPGQAGNMGAMGNINVIDDSLDSGFTGDLVIEIVTIQ